MTRPLRVLITNHMLSGRTGTELYVRDLAKGLLALGHTPVVYSSHLGTLAHELSLATVAVVDDLEQLAAPPDVIHGQHTLESAIALLHFPQVPALYVCHDWSWENDIPPLLPRIRRFVAVDDTVRDRLILRERIPEHRVAVVNNGVDLNRFQSRGKLPALPRKALVLSNYMSPEQASVVRAACQPRGISVDAVGAQLGNVSHEPEKLIGRYDLVFAKGRCAWEALATGASVIVCDTWGLGPLITTDNLEFARQRNFGRRLLQTPVTPETISVQVARYDAADAAEVSRRVRSFCGLDQMVAKLLAHYEQAVAEYEPNAQDMGAELRSLSRLLQSWNRGRHIVRAIPDESLGVLRTEHDLLRERLDALTRRRGLRKLAHLVKQRISRLVQWRAA